MNAHFFNRLSKAAAAASVALASMTAAIPARSADSVMVFFKDGRASEADIVSVGETELEFRLPGVPSVQKLPYTQIDYIEFAAPEAWLRTMEIFDKGEYEKVIDTFKQISTQKVSVTGYPAPGNFATKAERRLIDCYRRLRDPGQIAYHSKRLEWDKLSPADRELRNMVKCWELVGDEKWEEAQQAIAETAASMADTDPASAELNFLLALVQEGQIPKNGAVTEDEIAAVGKLENEAVVQYGRSFGIDAGADPRMAAIALKQSIQKLVGKEDREAELRALVHLYAGLHGDGELWADAGDYLVKLHSEELEVFSTMADAKAKDKKVGDGKIHARYIRIERVADEPTFVTLGEVQIMSGQENIAFLGKAKQSSNGKIGDRQFPPKLAIDGKNASGFQVGSFSRTEKEDEPWWELDLGAMKLIEEIHLYNCKNNKGEFVKPPGTFRFLLLDGDRQEVFEVEGKPSPEPKLSIKVGGGDDPPAEPAAPVEAAEPEDGDESQ